MGRDACLITDGRTDGIAITVSVTQSFRIRIRLRGTVSVTVTLLESVSSSMSLHQGRCVRGHSGLRLDSVTVRLRLRVIACSSYDSATWSGFCQCPSRAHFISAHIAYCFHSTFFCRYRSCCCLVDLIAIHCFIMTTEVSESPVEEIQGKDSQSPFRPPSVQASFVSILAVIIVALLIWIIVLSAVIANQNDRIHNVENQQAAAGKTAAVTAIYQTNVVNNYTAVGSMTLPLSPTACSLLTQNQSVAVSLGPDNRVIAGAGTSLYLNAQTHYYSPSFTTPHNLWITHIINDTVLMSFGTLIAIAWPDSNGDWVTGNQYNFNNGNSPLDYGPFSTLPAAPDNIVFLSLVNSTTALLVAVSGTGVIALSADLNSGIITLGTLTVFVSGLSVDADSTAIDNSTFAISYYYESPAILLETIVGTVSFPDIIFSSPLNYSLNHEFHQIVGLGPGLYGLAFPYDTLGITHTSTASPMGLFIAAVSGTNPATKSITIFSSDGTPTGSPWVNSNLIGWYFFDMLLVDREELSDGVTCAVALSVIDRSAADAVAIFILTVTAKGKVGSFSGVDVRFGSQLIGTTAGATIGFNYYAMSPLFDLSTQMLQTTQPSLPGKRDILIAWQDTAKLGAVEAIIISYDVTQATLALVVPTTAITPPFSSSSAGTHWWIAGGALSSGKVLLLSTAGQTGVVSIVEHLSGVVGVRDIDQSNARSSCFAGTQNTIDVVVDGLASVSTASLLQSSSSLTTTLNTISATTRGDLLTGSTAIMTVQSTGNNVTVSVGGDSCVGFMWKQGNGVWLDSTICGKLLQLLN